MNKKHKIVATIEARMTSSRFPGKVLMKVLGKPMLYYLVKRLRMVQSLDEIVLATTTNIEDDILATFAIEEGIPCFRGSEEDVMGRVIGAAESVNADIIVEITGDCPLIDPQIIEQIIRIFEMNNVEYVSNVVKRCYPDGMDVQVFSLETLKKSAEITNKRLDREHVTLHIRNNPALFSQIHVISTPDATWPELGLTLDEFADFELISKIIKHFEGDEKIVTCQQIISLLKENPEWVKLNEFVQRKENS